jgi:hypothetical protein
MNQCSPVAVHSLREARACHVSVASSQLSALGCQFSVDSSQLTVLSAVFTENGELRTDILIGGNKTREVNQCTGRPTAPLRESPTVLVGGNSVHRATYCAHNYPLPLLPSGPGGVGGITSRRTRHRNHFITQHSPSPARRNLHPCKTCRRYSRQRT